MREIFNAVISHCRCLLASLQTHYARIPTKRWATDGAWLECVVKLEAWVYMSSCYHPYGDIPCSRRIFVSPYLPVMNFSVAGYRSLERGKLRNRKSFRVSCIRIIGIVVRSRFIWTIVRKKRYNWPIEVVI